MATRVFIPVRGKRLRITKLDSCGRVPEAGATDSFIVTDGFINVQLSAVVEDGTEIVQRNIAGALCVNELASSSFKRFTVTAEFCGVNPALLTMVSNAEPYEDHDGNISGFTIPEGDIEKWFALELWTGLSGAACAEGVDEASGYLLLPFIQGGTLGDVTIDGENAVTFSMQGAYTKGGNAWGVGPYEVVYDDSEAAAQLPTALDGFDHLLLMDTGLAVPAADDDPQPMPTTTP